MRVVVAGFPFSPGAVDAVARTLLGAGAEIPVWLLHPNRVDWLAPTLRRRHVPVVAELPAPGAVEDLRRPLPASDLDGRATEDLRYLVDREGHFDHEWARTLFLDRARLHIDEVLDRAAPDLVLFGDLPHSVGSFLAYHWARGHGVPTAVVRYGPTPHHVTYVDTVDAEIAQFASERIRSGAPTGPSESSARYLAKLRGTYEEARPAWMQGRTGPMGTVRAAARRATGSDPRRVAAGARGAVARRRLRHDYDERTDPGALAGDGPVVSVFLHLQPERTTTPEGGRFAQQWTMVQTLAATVPAGWRILVREHPSTFRVGARIVRDAGFYDSLRALRGVSLVPLSATPFSLVDRSTFVATVTGTVGLEAVARGGRALVFGNAAYSGCPGTRRADRDGLDEALFADPPAPPDADGVASFLADLDRSARCWVAPADETWNVRELRSSGHPFPPLLQAMLDDPAIVST